MKRIITFILISSVLFSFCCMPCSSVEEYDCPRFYLKLAEPYVEGDTSLVVELHADDSCVYGISFFGFTMDYTLNVALKKSVNNYRGVCFSESVVETPYSIFGVAVVDDFFVLPFEDVVMATFYFDIIDVGYDGPVEITLAIDSENGVGDGYGEPIDDDVIVEGLALDITLPDVGNGDDTSEEEIPDFDDLNYTGSDSIYMNQNFVTAESFSKDFLTGAFYIEDGLMCGWAEAKALQSIYTQTAHNGHTIFDKNSSYIWRTYDLSMTLSLRDDETSKNDRWINLCYCNDNMIYAGVGSDRQFITFSYDFGNKCFRLANGWNNTSPEGQFMSPVYKEICMDDSEFMNLGISVSRSRLRCFYNGELIFDYMNPNFRIAHHVGSPFLLWNDGNVVRAKNITVAKQGYFFPLDEESNISQEGCVTGSDGLLVSYYGDDTVVLPDFVSKIGKFALLKNKEMKNLVIKNDYTMIEDGALFGLDDVTIRCYSWSEAEWYAKKKNINYRLIIPGDVDDDGSVTTTDTSFLSRKITGA